MSTAQLGRTAVAVALAGVFAFLSSVTRAQVSNAPATTAASAHTAGSGDQLQEVVVTAQFRAETAQETPISITAVTGEQLAQQGAQNIIDVAEQTPNVTMRQASTGSGRSNQAFIRGIGQGDFLLAYSPRVAFYVDDVYFSTVFGSIFDLMDVDHVEVLRGPQGTLFGRNAVGGAIRLYSQKPKGDGSGYLSAGGGSDAYYAVRGAIDRAIIPDTLMFRISAGWHKQDGWVQRINFKCAFPALGGALPSDHGQSGCGDGTLGGTNVFSTRGELRWKISEKLDNNINVDYMLDNSQTAPDTLTAAPWYTSQNPSTHAFNGAPVVTGNGFANWFNAVGGPKYGMPLGGGTIPCRPNPCSLPSAALQAALYPNNPYVSYADAGNIGLGRAPNPATGDPGAQFDDPPTSTLHQFGVSNTLDGQIWDGLNLKSVTAYREYRGKFGASQASMPVPVQEAFQGVTHHQFSEELTLTGSIGKIVDWTVGGFLLDTHERNYGRVQFEGFAVAGMPFVQDFQINDPAVVHNRSEFIHTMWHLTSQLDLEAGIRHSHENLTYQFYRNYFYYFGLPTSIANFTRATSVQTNRNNPRISLNYRPTPDLLVYASYSTGFTAGGINGRPFVKTDVFGFGPEDLKSYEVGIHSEWLERRLRINADAFYMQYNNIQTTLFGCQNVPGATVQCRSSSPFYVDNGGNAHIKGTEIELEAHPVVGLMLTAGYGYQKFNYVYINHQANPTGNPLGLTLDSPLFGVPSSQLNLGALYSLNLFGKGMLSAHLDLHHQSAEWFDTAKANPYTTQAAYTIFNGALTYAPSSKWQLLLNVTNLTDKLYYTSKFDGRNSLGYASGSAAQPREWILSMQRNF